MPYRNIVISSSVRISVKNDQLVISGEAEGSVPIEDIRVLMIESQSATISSYALSFLAQKGICVFLCDDKHLPCALLTPFAQYSRQKKQIELQFSQSKPKLKNMWSEIVISKILNQAKCLELCGVGEEGVKKLRSLTKRVLSGDSTNVEAYAASLYFTLLFGEVFSRKGEDDINSALNYGYAIIRGFICRTIAKYGYEPSIGIHHCSQLNNFNLADDIIEPFRPIVDLFVYRKCLGIPFDRNIKLSLVSILNHNIIYKGQKQSVAYAIEQTIQSLGRNFMQEDDHLILPELIDLEIHEYE